MSRGPQLGVALVTVLLIVAMATTVAAYMAQQQGFWQRELEMGRDRVQARRIAQAGVDWARAVLADDAGNPATKDYDHPREMWAMQLPAVPVDGGEVQGVILDQQGLFNLNNLVKNGAVSQKDMESLKRLLAFLGLPQELAYTLADWVDANNEPMPGGAEDGYYLALPVPYRAANRQLSELSELMRVKGYDAGIIKRLAPYVSVLPESDTPVNVNFAQPEVLASVVPGLSLQDARQIALDRKGGAFKSVADVKLLPAGAAQSATLSVSSKYFLVEGRAVQRQSEFAVQVLLSRGGQTNWPSVVRQSMQ